jgi:PAS domain S-box-containing protein
MDQINPNESPLHELVQLRQQYAELKTAYEKNISVQKQTGEALRQRAENKLKENYNLIRIAGEKAKLGGWNVILKENRTYWSDEVAAIHEMPAGYSPLVEDGINFYAPEWHDKIREVFGQCAFEGIPYDEEMEIITASGKRVWVRTMGEAVRDEKGNIVKVQGAFQDISTLKQTEEIIKQDKELLNNFFKQSLTGFFIMMIDEPVIWNVEIDKEKVLDYVFEHQYFVKVNQAMLNQYLAGEADFLNKTPNDLFAQDIKQGRKAWKELFDKGSLHIITKEQRFDGSTMWIEGDYICLYDSLGRITGHFGNQQDITERKKADAELIKAKSTVEKSEIRYRTVVSNSPVVTFVLNPDGIFTLSEGKGLEKLGLKPGQVVGLSALELYKDFPVIINDIKKALAGNISRSETVLPGVVFDILYNPVFDNKGNFIEVIGVANDITERKQADIEIKKHKSELEEYFENDISADYVVSVSGEIFSCNKTFLNLFGFKKKSDAEKFDISGLYKNPIDRQQVILLVKKQGKVENHEIEFISKEGKTIYALINAIGIFDKDNKLEKIRGYIVDISEQKYIEKELYKSEEKYRLLFANNPQPMWIYELETLAFLEVNQAAMKHYGYSKEEFLSMTLKDIRPEEDIPALLEDIKNTHLNLNSAGEWRHLKKNGELINVEITSHSVIFNDRKARHILVNDITERKRAQLEYQTMIKTSRDGFWIVDAHTGKFLEVNQSYCEMIGYSHVELLQMTIPDIEAVESYEETRQHIELIKEKGFDSFESRHKTRSGKIIDIEASVTFIGSDINKFFVFVKDISERKRVENEISKLSHAVEQSPASIIVTDLEGNIEYINPKTIEITGYTKEELIGKNPRMINSGEKPKEEYQQLWSTILSGKQWFGEFHNKKKNGELYWESASISPILNEKKKIINYVAIKEDITERKRFEDTRKLLLEISQLATKHITLTSFLAEVHQKIKQIIRADNFYVALYNKADNTYSFPYHVDEYDKVELNKAYDFSKGYTDFVLKSNQSLIVTPEYKHEVEIDGTIKGYGDELSVWLGVPFKTAEGGKPNGVIAIQDYKNRESYTETDKTIMEIIAFNIGSFIERIKYMEELVHAKEIAEESEQRSKSLIENAPDGVVIINESGKFVYVSPNAARLFGYNINEVIGHFGYEYTHPDDLPLVLKTIETIINNPLQKPTVNYRFRRKNGEYRWIETTFTNLLSDKAINGIILNFTDVTERRQILEDLVTAKEKAEESDRLKSAFLSNMSHEIRTPMNGILGFTELLLEPDLNSEEKDRYIKIVHKSGQRMLNTVTDIVEISKIEAGLVQLNLTETDVNGKMEELFRFFKPEADKKGIKLSLTTLLPEALNNTTTDQNKLYSILTNLIKNAIKYTDEGTIEFGCKTVSSVHEPMILFYIKDSGIGIPADRQEAIFDRFIQADITDTRAFQGSGLGLAISKSYVEMLGGSIWVESIPDGKSGGKGSTFYFTLPLTKFAKEKTVVLNEIPVDSEKNKAMAAMRSLKILIAEDDETSRNYISLIINDFNAKILEARTGIETVELCRNTEDVDLILMDIQMPIMNGYEATRLIREFNKEVIIIAQTAFALSGDKEKAIEAGCNDYIAKPIRKEELRTKIAYFFGKSR